MIASGDGAQTLLLLIIMKDYMTLYWHSVFYGVGSWRSYGMEYWSGVKFWSGVPWISDAHPSSKHAKYMK